MAMMAREFPVGNDELGKAAEPIRVLIADDFPHMQQALVSCLHTITGVQVVATALNGQAALEKAKDCHPNLALVDLQMPVMDGFKLLRELRRIYPTMHLVAISGHQSAAIAAEAISAGANAFVTKNDLPHGLVSAVRKLLLR